MKPLCGNLTRILVGNPLGGSYADGVYTGMWVQGSINIDTGEETSSGTGVRSGYLDARENAYYTQRTIGRGTFDKISWYFYTSEKKFLGVKTDTTWTALELAPVNCAYIRLVISNNATLISPEDVPDITLEDRSIWGWKDANIFGACYSSKNPEITDGHYYYQKNALGKQLRFQLPNINIYNNSMKNLKDITENTLMFIAITEEQNPTDIGDMIFEDRDVWGWYISAGGYLISQAYPIEKRLVTVDYEGDLRNPTIGFYDVNSATATIVPITDYVIDPKYKTYRLFCETLENPNITAADMVNHGTWTVTFSDPVSEVWKSDGSVYYTPHNSEIQIGKILAITPPESFKAVSLVVKDATGQNSHDITGGAEVTLSESTEWVYLTVGIAENPDVNLTNIDSFREQWSYSYKDIPTPVEPHWDGENFVFTAADIKEGKAYQKSGNDIVLVDDASSIALPIIPNVSARWTILIDNSSDSPLNGVEIRKTASGVTVGDGAINANSGRSVILMDATGEVAFHFTKATLTAESLYNAIKIHGR